MSQLYLFVPAHDERKVARAVQAPVDAVIFDLEASVPIQQKQVARQAAASHVNTRRQPGGPELWIRVNDDPQTMQEDLDGIDWKNADGVVIPRAESREPLAAAQAAGVTRALPLIESAKGFDVIRELATIPIVEQFAIGTWDLLVDLGLFSVSTPDESALIWQLRGELVVASRQAGVKPPIDGIYSDLTDDDGFRAACTRGHQLGYAGKLLVHPRQIETARAVFAVPEGRLEFAREVIAAYEDAVRLGRGAISVRGQVVDLPMVQQARALVARALPESS